MSVPNSFAAATAAIPLANLDANFAYYDGAFQIGGNIFTFLDTVQFQDVASPTKVGQFSFAGITAGTTVTYTFPNLTGTLATIGNLAQTFAGTTAFSNTLSATSTITLGGATSTVTSLGTTATTGTLLLGGVAQTGTITLAQSTAAHTLNIDSGATIAAATKTINIGGSGVSTSITNVNIGSAVAGSLGTTRNSNNVTFDFLRAITTSAPTIASAAIIAPTTQILFVSGVTAIDTITAPSPISIGGGQITIIPTGLFTTTVAGNIALASVAVVNKALTLTYNAATLKWYPSY